MKIIQNAKITVDTAARFQTVDGFGVNINSKYWRNGELAPVIDLLVKDLGATLFRLDCWGRADWVETENFYESDEFQKRARYVAVSQ